MIAYTMEDWTGRHITYRYSIEGREEDSGRAVVTLTEDEADVEGIDVTEPAPSERAIGYAPFAWKLLHVVRGSIRTGDWREEGAFLWY